MWGEAGVSAPAIGDSELNARGDGFASSSAAEGGARTGGCRVLPAPEFRERAGITHYNGGEMTRGGQL